MRIIEIIGRHGGTQINLFGIPSAPAVADQYGQNRSLTDPRYTAREHLVGR